jgi:23S rRNA (adenine2503-C2)-methyltransferase
MNPTPLSADHPSSESTIERFAASLRAARVNVTIRDTRGREIDAACGQLRLRAEGGTTDLSISSRRR